MDFRGVFSLVFIIFTERGKWYEGALKLFKISRALTFGRKISENDA